MKRVNRFLFKLLFVFVIIALIVMVLYFIQMTFHIFDKEIKQFIDWIAYVNQASSYSLIAGVTVGSIIFILAVAMFPLFLRGVNKKNYWVSLQKGLIASFVFFISQIIYKFTANIGKFYFYLTVFAIIVITIILIEIITLSMKEEKAEAEELRTDIIASITSGLIFGVIIKVIEVGLHEIKNLLSLVQ